MKKLHVFTEELQEVTHAGNAERSTFLMLGESGKLQLPHGSLTKRGENNWILAKFFFFGMFMD